MSQHRSGRDFIARHGETVYNAAKRFQEGEPRIPLTREGCAQANEMGRALRAQLGAKPALTVWCSTAERAAQTLAIILDWLELPYFDTRFDERLVEIHSGHFGGRSYDDVMREVGRVVLDDGVLKVPADGETYAQVADRLRGWIADTAADPGDRLVVSHGNTSRVLRGMLTGLLDHRLTATPFAPALPQGSYALIAGGRESVPHRGTGAAPAT